MLWPAHAGSAEAGDTKAILSRMTESRKGVHDSDARGIADGVDRVFRLLTVLILLLAVTLAGVFLYLIGSMRPDQHRYRSVARALAVTHAAMLDEESSLRGYLLVEHAAFLEHYQHGVTTVAKEYATLNRSIGADRQMAPLLLTMRVAQQAWESEWAAAVVAGRVPRGSASVTAFYSRGEQLFQAYRSAEQSLSDRVQARRDSLFARQGRVLAGGLSATVVLGAFVLFVAVRQRRRLKDAVVEPVVSILSATEAIARLDLTVELEPSGPAEFRRIGESIRRMRDALSDSLYHELATQERVEAQAEQLRTILAMSREISGSLNLGYVLGSVASAASRVSGFPRVIIWLTDDESGKTLSGVYDSTTDHGIPEEDLRAQMGIGVVGQAVRYGRTATGNESGEPTVEVHPERSLRTMAVPLIVGARVSGAIELSSPTPQLMTAGSLDVLETLASHAAAAIEAATLHTYTAELAHTDGLTGLANRRLLDHDLALECERAARYERPLALVMFDVDHFKRLNDSYGHARGDEVLQQLAEAVREEVRSTDTVYRYGGEEFAVLAREADADEALRLAERLRLRIEERFSARGSFGQITASFGIALVPPSSPVPAEVVAAADAALYQSKADGRNRVTSPLGPEAESAGERSGSASGASES
jgi:diguanylate cyclase (GGDEF)-like protein